MNNALEKAIKIAKKTGDRVIVADSATDSAFVVISLGQYEEMLEQGNERLVLTHEKMIDKINRDIAEVKREEEEAGNFGKNAWNEEDEYDESVDREEYEDFTEMDDGEEDEQEKRTGNRRSSWRIPKERKGDEIGDVDDDKQYLEDIPF